MYVYYLQAIIYYYYFQQHVDYIHSQALKLFGLIRAITISFSFINSLLMLYFTSWI